MKFEQKNIEHLTSQVDKVNKLRETEGKETYTPQEGDYELDERGLIEKYGAIYEEFKEDLKRVINSEIEETIDENGVLEVAKNMLNEHQQAELEKEIEKEFKDKPKELSKLKKFVFNTILSIITISVLGVGVNVFRKFEEKAEKYYKEKEVAGKINPILAAQSSGGLIFMGDNGATVGSENFGSIEQVIVYPASISESNELEKAEVTKKFNEKKILVQEYKKEIWNIEHKKQQGFLDAYEKKFITFEELVKNIKEANKKGKKTTLNFGDSSTSGWESNIVTKNSVEVAEFMVPLLHKIDRSMPSTFYELVKAKHGLTPDIQIDISKEAEKIKSHPNFEQVWKNNWDNIRKLMQSPFMQYDTYSDKMAQLDTNHHYVNLGVPGYSSVHGKAFAQRMFAQLEKAEALKYVDAVTLYFGNNDCVNNGNVQDKYFFGDKTSPNDLIHATGFIQEALPKIFNTTRVSPRDFRDNISYLIMLCKEKGIKNITIMTPVVPLDWSPGLRAVNDAQEVINRLYEAGGKSSILLNKARESFADYSYHNRKGMGVIDYSKLFEAGEKAKESDFMVPRIKQDYKNILADIAGEYNISFINIEPTLPVIDRESVRSESGKRYNNITNDYCHPGEHANILLALAQIIARNNGKTEGALVNQSIKQLTELGVPFEIAEYEVNKVIQSCLITKGETADYRRLATEERIRATWDSQH